MRFSCLTSGLCGFGNFSHPGSRYFCESFYGHPCPTSSKSYATANACGCPSRPASFVGYPSRGIQHHSRNDSTRCRKACIFTTQKTLRENTCPIASGDYSTPVSQRMWWLSPNLQRASQCCLSSENKIYSIGVLICLIEGRESCETTSFSLLSGTTK